MYHVHICIFYLFAWGCFVSWSHCILIWLKWSLLEAVTNWWVAWANHHCHRYFLSLLYHFHGQYPGVLPGKDLSFFSYWGWLPDSLWGSCRWLVIWSLICRCNFLAVILNAAAVVMINLSLKKPTWGAPRRASAWGYQVSASEGMRCASRMQGYIFPLFFLFLSLLCTFFFFSFLGSSKVGYACNALGNYCLLYTSDAADE